MNLPTQKILKALILGLILFAGPARATTRVITLTPGTTELWFQIGRPSDLVGCTQPTNAPAEAAAITSVGTLMMPNLERLLTRNPDWVLTEKMQSFGAWTLGLRAVPAQFRVLNFATLADLVTETDRLLRDIYGANQSATWQKLSRCVTRLHAVDKPSFQFVALVSIDPPILFGHQSFVSDLLTQLGGTNLATAKFQPAFPLVSPEWLMTQKIDRIFFLGEDEFTLNEFRKRVKKIWPRNPPPWTALSPDQFARVNLTPIRNISKLNVLTPSQIPLECHEL